jgi:hypothetical protein
MDTALKNAEEQNDKDLQDKLKKINSLKETEDKNCQKDAEDADNLINSM